MFRFLLNKFKKNNTVKKEDLIFHKINSLSQYNKFISSANNFDIENLSFENKIKDNNLSGYCYVCDKSIDFIIDRNNNLSPNWRETLTCPSCNLNNRLRASYHIFNEICKPSTDCKIYITEQITLFYKLLKRNFPDTIGSEFLDNNYEPGKYYNKIRHENLTKLSFPDEYFDFILSFDVLEHIPDFKKAIIQCYQKLKSKGYFLFSIPFIKNSQDNIIRACITKNNEIKHILPPEYHGDPVNRSGCLCFYHFGWEILEILKETGFKNSNALLYWSKFYGYLGGWQIIFIAEK